MISPLDAMTAAAKAHFHEAIPVLRGAAVFDLHDDPCVDAYLDWQRTHVDIADEWLDEFFMPFSSVVILLEGGATLLSRDPSIRGLWAGSDVPQPDREGFADRASGHKTIVRMSCTQDVDTGRYFISAGYAHGWLKNEKGELVFRCAEGAATVVTRSGSVLEKLYWDDMWQQAHERSNVEEIAEMCRANTIISLRRLWWALQPSNWIVKKSPEMARITRRGAVPLDHERERYLVMSQKAIERTFRVPNPENTGRTLKVGHRRRACWHTLKHERWGERRGQRIHVQGCWVGPEEVVVGGERYRVLLDSPGWNPNDLPDLPDGTIELPS